MAGYVNKAIIIGNLGADPEIKEFPDGNKICNLSVATTEKWTAKDGEKREKTEWHRVVVRQSGSSKIIDAFIGKYVKKGHKVYVEGKIETRKWEQDGTTRYTTEIFVAGPNSSFELLERAPKGDNEKSGSDIPFEKPARIDSELDDQIPGWD
jgi:single-strand DNA-binding protein